MHVSQYLHRHITDINPEQQMDAREWDSLANVCVGRATTALRGDMEGYTKEQRDHISDMFISMAATNRGIRRMLNHGWGDPSTVDVLALARLQLEGLYALCLMLESPQHVDCFRRYYWRTMYAQYLLMREEVSGLPRFQEWASETPTDLIKLGLHFGVTKAQLHTVENEELGTPIPQGIQREPIVQFPTPGRAINHIAEGNKKRMLERLYPKYQDLCSFAHSSGRANLFKMMFDERAPDAKFATDQERADKFQAHVLGEASITSFFSIAQATAELTLSYPNCIELPSVAMNSWNQLSEASLWTKAIWEIRTRNLLGAIS